MMRQFQRSLTADPALRGVAGLAVALSCLGAPSDTGVEDAPAAAPAAAPTQLSAGLEPDAAVTDDEEPAVQ